MRRTFWIIGLTLAAAVALSVTLFATDAASQERRTRPQGGTPASIQLTPEPLAIQCDGVDSSTITVRVTDARARTVPDGTIVHFDARFGSTDPVEASTRRGEATTEVRFFPAALQFPRQTEVDVFVGDLRASIGVDCIPPVPCNPFSPPAHPMSPPCQPLPCSTTDSPPIGQSPPCPLTVCDAPFSPPCNLYEMRLDANQFAGGVQDFASYPVGSTFGLSVHATSVGDEPYAGYQWLIEWPASGLAFDGVTFEQGPFLGLETCEASPRPPVIDPSYDNAFGGGCRSETGASTSFVGELTQLQMTCTAPGYFMIQLVGKNVTDGFASTFIALSDAEFPTTTHNAFVLCEQPPCAPTSSPPCATPTPEPCGPATSPPCEVASETLRPTADGTYLEWGELWGSGTTHWDRVADVVPDDLDSYIMDNTWNGQERDTFQLSDTSIESIAYIEVFVRAFRITTNDNNNVRVMIRSGTTDAQSRIRTLSSNWSHVSELWSTDPATGQPWTQAGVNALQAGMRNAMGPTGGGGVAVTQVYVVVHKATCGQATLPPCEVTLALDANITNGSGPCTQIDDVASIAVGQQVQVGVCLVNRNGTVPIAAFQYRIGYDDRIVVVPDVANEGTALDDNPDANVGATTFTSSQYPASLGGGWDCSAGVGAFPEGDRFGVPGDGIGNAYSGGCGSALGPNTLVQGPLGVITFSGASGGITSLSFVAAAVTDDALEELGTCTPVVDVPMACLGATIIVTGGTGTATSTPALADVSAPPNTSTPTPAVQPIATIVAQPSQRRGSRALD